MADKKVLKKLFVAGAATGLLSTALGSAFIENYLSKKGIKSAIASSALNPSENSNCFYESDEAKLGIEFYRSKPCKEIFTFNKFSRTLFADYYEAESKSNIYVISCHGFTGLPSQNSIFTRKFLEMGYNVLLPYLRAHGKSEHNYCTMGYLERLDIIDWVNYIIDKNPDAKIILHGASMGAATVMMATGERLPSNVICCIEDCGFTSLCELYNGQIKAKTKIPPFIILNVVNAVSKFKLGCYLYDVSPIDAVRQSQTPTLFIHGDKDNVVPFSMLHPLFKNASCEKEMLVVEGATHAASAYVYPEIYWDAVSKFINKYL